ncbi:hypothetical protein BDY24DRAFT_386140 [Mrakia frigida]|uniref:uncharacterized protein n=1 Tax=Mrakia frigida TaxID=29902 RepID=UPI003FCC0CF3
MERELEEVRTREGGEKELKEALEAKDREIGSLVSEKKSLTSALKELESERTKQMDQFSAFSASFQSFNKRPLPLDASSSSSSSSQPPAKKFKEIDPIYTNGMPSTEAEKTVFVDYWTNKLIPKKAEGRMCVLCKNAAGARPREPLHFASDVLKSEPLMSKALVAHLVPLHAEHWDRICSGIGKK